MSSNFSLSVPEPRPKWRVEQEWEWVISIDSVRRERDTQKYSENSMKFIDDEINTQESCSSSWREFFEVSLAAPLSYHIPRQGSERISRSLLLPSNLLHSSSLALPLLFMRPTVRRDARSDWMRQTKAQRVRGDPRPKAKANQHFFLIDFRSSAETVKLN